VTPDIYANGVNFTVGVWDVTMEFTVRESDGTHKKLAKVRMSPQHALIMAKLFAKNMKKYEEEIGKIGIPQSLYKELDIEESKW